MSIAIVEWSPIVGEDVPKMPRDRPLLVRDEAGHHYVATPVAAMWRINGAPERVVYGITHWAEITDADASDAGEVRLAA